MATGSIPTLTIMKHSTSVVFKKAPTQTLRDFLGKHKRLHDPCLIKNDNKVIEAGSLLMLDLGITERNFKHHRVLVMSSPYQKCIETAVIICQLFGVESFYIHFGLGESMNGVLSSGWNWAEVALYLTSSEMRQLVSTKSRNGEREGRNKVSIAGFLGQPLSMADVGENQREFTTRVLKSLDDIKNSLENQGDHMIVVGHHDTIVHFADNLGDGMEIFDDQDVGFLTFAMQSKNSQWLTGRSRIQVVPK